MSTRLSLSLYGHCNFAEGWPYAQRDTQKETDKLPLIRGSCRFFQKYDFGQSANLLLVSPRTANFSRAQIHARTRGDIVRVRRARELYTMYVEKAPVLMHYICICIRIRVGIIADDDDTFFAPTFNCES